MRRLPAVLAAVAALAAVLALPANAGEASIVKPPSIFAKNLAKVKSTSGLDVFLPSNMRVFTNRRVYGEVNVADGFYDLELGIGKRCRGANACFIGNFTGTSGGRPAFKRKVALANGRTGYWKGITCGASCSPAEIEWKDGGVLYTVATKSVTQNKEKATLVKLANSAIEAGPR